VLQEAQARLKKTVTSNEIALKLANDSRNVKSAEGAAASEDRWIHRAIHGLSRDNKKERVGLEGEGRNICRGALRERYESLELVETRARHFAARACRREVLGLYLIFIR
jgi:hypothetical protein